MTAITGRVRRIGSAVICALITFAAARMMGQPPAQELRLVELDGSSKVLGRVAPSTFAPRISPDGKRVAFETRDPAGPDGAAIWIADLSNLADRRSLPSAGGMLSWAPMWTPDGERLVFLVSSDRPDAIYWRPGDGTGTVEHLVDARSAEGWVGGGAQMRFLTLTGNRDYGISLLDMKTHGITSVIDLPGSAQHSSAVSPDGRWMAYASNETGRYEVWLEPFPKTGARYRLTQDGGSHPLWRPDGQSLYFDRDRQLFQLSVNLEDPSVSAVPVPLPIKGFAQGEYRRQYDLMPNARQFVMLFPSSI